MKIIMRRHFTLTSTVLIGTTVGLAALARGLMAALAPLDTQAEVCLDEAL